jgi:hypothetical protein
MVRAMTDLLTRLLALAELAVDEALEFEYGDPEDRHIWRELQELKPLVATALSQPEAEGPTDEEILALSQWHEVSYTLSNGSVVYPMQEGTDMKDAVLSFTRAVLTRWGRPAIEPVPVSERPILKSSNFNDANGHCWCGTSASVDETGDLSVEMPPSWELRKPCAQDDCVLPHHALPVLQP